MEAKNWEDTVMTSEQRAEAIGRSVKFLNWQHQAIAQSQAKTTWPIAFKAGEDKGKQEGFDKVVQFVIDNKMIPLCDYKTTGTIRQDEEHREDCRRCKWQAFLKERGK